MFGSKEDKFFLILVKATNNVKQSAELLRLSLDNLKEKEKSVTKIEALEDEGEELIRTVTKELDEAFITPIDREDIYEIIKGMDDILDLISSAIHRFVMFNINESTEECKVLSDMLVNITVELFNVMEEINKNGCKSKKIVEKIDNIAKIEDKADSVFRKTVAVLFKNKGDILNVIKWKEIYQIIEDTIDECKEIGDIIEGVVIKNA